MVPKHFVHGIAEVFVFKFASLAVALVTGIPDVTDINSVRNTYDVNLAK